jgi:hypothetical protein
LRREDGTLLDKVMLTASAGSISGDSSIISEPTGVPVEGPAAGCGDVNGDGDVNIVDALLVARY